MNSRQKIVQQSFLDDEAGILRLLYRSYSEALEGIKAGVEEKYEAIAELTEEINDLPPNDPKRVVLEGQRMAKVYQKQYQESLERQVSGILGDMDAKNYANVTDYLEGCYDNGFLGAMYDIHGQGIPLTLPINQQKAVHAVQTDSKISEGLYRRLGKDTAELKRKITSQVSRSMVMGGSYGQCAQALERQTEIGFNRAARIARTEGHRIQVTAAMDALYDAREAGADVVKQWDATLDKRTRRSHARCDGEIREIDDTFGNGLMCPGDPKGPASEVVNCRCALLQRARWGLDDEELETLKERAEFYGLDKTSSFEEFKERYLEVTEAHDVPPVTEWKKLANPKHRNWIEIADDRKRARRKGESGAILGALNDENDPNMARREKHAVSFYDEVRKRDKGKEVSSVAKNSEVEEETVSKAYNHLFVNKYHLEKGYGRFDESYDIAESWRRLREGKDIKKHDLTLLWHEAYEYDLMKAGMEYDDAHKMAEKRYNYAKELKEFLKGGA